MTEFDSPAGKLLLYASEGTLLLCDWEKSRLLPRHMEAIISKASDCDTEQFAVSCLETYFSTGNSDCLHQIKIDTTGTPFYRKVWNELRNIPCGITVSYSDLAYRLASHPRAVARAVGANPVSLFIPCHRIIGKNGSLTGYAGGLEAKALLLDLERIREEGSQEGSLPVSHSRH